MINYADERQTSLALGEKLLPAGNVFRRLYQLPVTQTLTMVHDLGQFVDTYPVGKRSTPFIATITFATLLLATQVAV